MVDRLLDFLGAPSEEQTHEYIKKHNSRRATPKKTSENSEDEEMADAGDDADDKEGDGGEKSEAELKGKRGSQPKKRCKKADDKVPDDKVLRKWVRAYVACHNMSTATLRHAVEVASDKFGVDMKVKKESIKMFLTEEC